MTRADGREPQQLRPVKLTAGFMPYAEGSCLVEMGETKVVGSATVEGGVPKWLQGKGLGWVTAEYGMLPRSSPERIARESSKGRLSGRTQEIQRLIGRALRAVVDMKALPEITLWVDCDVLQADGGTRTASITGGFVACAQALAPLAERGTPGALLDSVAAVSVGIVDGSVCLDLNYDEDSRAQVDMNVVMTGTGKLVEVQGTAEHGAFERSELDDMLDVAMKGIVELTALQEHALGVPAVE